MTNPPFAPLRIEDLELDDQPEVALVVARRKIEARLEWLMTYLAPNQHRLGSDSILDVLKSQRGFDAKTVRAIRHVLTAANPVVHGRSVSPSVAAVVVESAVQVSAALDEMIRSLQGKLRVMPPRTRLAYAFLALPSITRRSLAMRLDLFKEDDDSLSRKEAARAVFERASRAKLLAELWTATAQESQDIPAQPPSELE